MKKHEVTRPLTILVKAAICFAIGLASGVPLPVEADSGSDREGEGKGAAVEGRRKYLEMNCYICHGGRGGGGMGPNIRDNRPNDDRIASAIRNGRPTGMPSYQGLLDDQDIEDITEYLRSLRSDEEPVFTHWWERVPTQ